MNDRLMTIATSNHEHAAPADDIRVMLMDANGGGLSSRRDGAIRAERKCALETGARGWRYAVRAH